MKGFRDRHTFCAPFKKKSYRLAITNESLSRISEIVSVMFRGFEPAAKRLEAEGHIE